MPILRNFRPKPLKIAILYTLAGGGHLSLAKAAQEALNRYAGRPLDITLYDPFPSTYSLTHKTLANQFLDLYRVGYFATDNVTMASAVHYVNYYGIERNLLRFLNSNQPRLVISNHPLITAALPKVISKIYFPIKTIAHFADPFTIHHTWFVNKKADLYLSPTPEITQAAISHDIPSSRIVTVGWLTREKFLGKPKDKIAIRQILGLHPHKFTIFIGGAGQGSSQIYQLCRRLSQNQLLLDKAQVIINTGLSAGLVTQILKLVQKHPGFFTLIPYANNMPELLTSADVAIGKAGPNFLFECVHSLLPVIAFGDHQGEQLGNLEFIKSAKLGWVEKEVESVIYLLGQFIQNPALINAATSSLKKIKSVQSSTPRKFTSAVLKLA